jgi:HEAT repeat protein
LARADGQRSASVRRWQAAVNLANALNNEKGPGFKELRRNREVVTELANVLEAEIAAGSMEENRVTFRIFLCRALGSFEVPEGLPALIKAVSTQRDPNEAAVRRSALEAIALLADNVRAADPQHPLSGAKLESALLAAASDPDHLVRSSAAFAIGVVGGESLLTKLRFMTEDSYPDVRYNAATGLARHGDPAAAPVFVEMLDPDEEAGVKIEEEQSRVFKRALIEFNALRAISTLLKANSQVDGQQFVPAIEKLLKSKPPNNVSAEATSLLREIGQAASGRQPAASN